MNRFSFLYLLCVYFFCVIAPTGLSAQNAEKEKLVFLNSEWKGERYEDGRPKLPDDLLERSKAIGLVDARTKFRKMGNKNRFEKGWEKVHSDVSVVWARFTRTFHA